MSEKDLSALPSVDRLLHTKTTAELIANYGRPLTIEGIRRVLEDIRTKIMQEDGGIPENDQILLQVQVVLRQWTASTLRSVINATGVILHTNLGRAPLSKEAIQAIQGVSQSYSNLEYDLSRGRRGSRLIHAEELLKRLTGAEAAVVVNNNASALLLILTTLARRRRVLISRTQLIEIGGGFRIPEVMKQSGAKLVEVGATNRVHLEDYQKALDEQPIVLLMRAHRSNFRIIGFTSEPSPEELATLAHNAGIPMVDDLGSGTLIDTTRFGLAHEVTVQEALEAGADLVCFSGDKLLGGPQAGIIVGKSKLVSKLKKHPMARALRADKLCIAALLVTLLHYVKDEAERKIPIWKMISTTPELIKARAQNWTKVLKQGEVIPGESTVGGGSLPGETLPTHLLSLLVPHPDKFMVRLRSQRPPIIARLEDDRVVLDPRTVLPEQEGALLVGLQNVLAPLVPK
jgi:L-seryl-tRNA(Ser) seleniumtransferase